MSAAPTNNREARWALRRKVSNVILMVPDTDWAAVLSGSKTMFRSYSRRYLPTILPTLAIAWRRGPTGLQTKTIVLEDTWQEPLGTVSEEDLRDEGFATLSDFRRYFEVRYPKGGYRPLATVQVYRVRPLREGDLEAHGAAMCAYLGYVP